MEQRYLKMLVALTLGLMALFYAAHNIANWDAAVGSLAYVLGQADHAVYSRNLAPAFGDGPIPTLLTIVICGAELVVALTLLLGTFTMWRDRRSDAGAFAAAKRPAIWGAAGAVLVWLGLFGAFGGALYQMWQTQIGAASLNDAFKFGVFGFLTLIWLSMDEPAPVES